MAKISLKLEQLITRLEETAAPRRLYLRDMLGRRHWRANLAISVLDMIEEASRMGVAGTLVTGEVDRQPFRQWGDIREAARDLLVALVNEP